MLLLLSHFSRVRLFAIPYTAAHQAPPSLGFSRQEHWSGLPFPSPIHESESEVAQSCLTLNNSMDCNLPGSSVHGIFQARVLEWVAIAFSAISWSLQKFMSIKSVKLSNHLILCCPLLLLPSVFPRIRVLSSDSVLPIRWPKYWSFSFSMSFNISICLFASGSFHLA